MIKKCKICNKEFKSKPSKNRIFCSKRCYGLCKGKNIVGENHLKSNFNRSDWTTYFRELVKE